LRAAKDRNYDGNMGKRTIVPIAALFIGACTPTEEQLRTRAAFDMQCPAEQLQVVSLDTQIRGVTGCGQRRTYVAVCNGQPGNAMTTCNWVADSSSAQAAAGPNGVAVPLVQTPAPPASAQAPDHATPH
jgi:hypothetical protein